MSGTVAGDGQPIVVRKYGNRRLYRTDLSRYVTLDELATMVRDDLEFVVVDAKTEDDLTGVVLAQVILEDEKRARGEGFPVDVLRQLIKLRRGAMLDFTNYHLPRLTRIYLEGRGAVGDSLDAAVALRPDAAETMLIGQLAAVREQLGQILDSLEVEEFEEEDHV